MRPATSEDETGGDDFVACACSGEALVSTTQSKDTVKRAFGDPISKGDCLTLVMDRLDNGVPFSFEDDGLEVFVLCTSRTFAGISNASMASLTFPTFVFSTILLPLGGEMPTRISPDSSSPSSLRLCDTSLVFLHGFTCVYQKY